MAATANKPRRKNRQRLVDRRADPDRVAAILEQPTASVVDAGYCLGIGRDGAYRGAKIGDIPVIKVGSLLRVPTAWIKKNLAGEIST